MSKYDINSIQSLSFKDAVRTRIQMYLGSDNMEGIYNGIQEIVTNSIDEFRVGYGDLISISLDTLSDGSQSVTVEDFGRGVPFGIKEDGSNTLVDIYSKSHTGGKFDSKAYQSSAGLNGIGAKAVALSSYYFKVESHRDGKAAVAEFKKGDLISYEEIESSRKNGTVVSYVPDPEVYKQEKIRIDFKELCSRYKRLSYLTKGMTFVLTDVKNKEVKTYSAIEGIKELVKEVSEDPVHASVIYGEAEEDGDSVEVAMCWNRSLRETSFVFTNGLENREGGTSLTGTKMALTRSLKKEIEGNVTGEILRTGLVYVVNSTVKHPSFAGQTKDKVNNTNLNGLAQRAVREALNSLIKDNSFEFTQIIDFLGKERKAEEAAEKARKEVREATKQIQNKTKAKSFSTDKLYDARYLGQDSILYLCEGGSAVGTLGNSRNPDRVGLLELRGKIINPLTSTEEKVLSNDEVQLIFAALGQTPGKYNPDKLRYGKVGIASDGDSDGAHIGLLVMTVFMELLPEFFNEGRLHWLHAPLYSTTKGKITKFYFTEKEFKERPKNSGVVHRMKGLGAMDKEEAEIALFGKEQRLEQILPGTKHSVLLKDLMGKSVLPRKRFIEDKMDFEKIRLGGI